MEIDFIDVKRAYYNAEAWRELYVELLEGSKEPGMCAKLLKALPGTRDAAQCWEYEYGKLMTELGFKRGIASPCTFYNQKQNIRIVVHGDDFTALAYVKELNWLKNAISKKWQITHRGRIGPDDNDSKA